jgi:hypothetical protein
MVVIQDCRHPSPLIANVLVAAMLLSGCHSGTPVVTPASTPQPPTAAAFASLKAGDTLRVTLHDGVVSDLELAEVQATGLLGKDGRLVAYADMARVERIHVSAGKTVALVGGIGAAFLLLFVWAASHLPVY